jgi:Fe-S-cluster containining protein
MPKYHELPELAKKKESEWNKFFAKNKKKIEGMDLIIHNFHNTSSSKINCLECANCCKSLGPRITDKDVERIAKVLRLSSVEVIKKYFRTDEDGDVVFKSMPCPFLGSDNYCAIYDFRPKACKEYPHTDRKKFFQLYKLSVKNAYTCPIVFDVLESINNHKLKS